MQKKHGRIHISDYHVTLGGLCDIGQSKHGHVCDNFELVHTVVSINVSIKIIVSNFDLNLNFKK
jgi:hypothetical protein